MRKLEQSYNLGAPGLQHMAKMLLIDLMHGIGFNLMYAVQKMVTLTVS